MAIPDNMRARSRAFCPSHPEWIGPVPATACLSMIPPWPEVVDHCLGLLAPGASLRFAPGPGLQWGEAVAPMDASVLGGDRLVPLARYLHWNRDPAPT